MAIFLGLPVVAFILYWIFWYLIDKQAFYEGSGLFEVFITDFIFCTVVSYAVMLICIFWHSLFYNYLNQANYNALASLLSVASSIYVAVLFEDLSDYSHIYVELNSRRVFEGYLICSLISCVISLIYLSHYNFRMYKKEVRQNELKEVALLKRQLDPHFLFNNLSSLDGLIDSDPAAAHVFLAKLSKVYRYMIQYTLNNRVLISEEINFIRSYEHLLHVRFYQHFSLIIDPQLEQGSKGYIVPMTLQLLIENSIKHNCHSDAEPIEIRIEAKEGMLVVSNTYRPFTEIDSKSGHGLDNLDRRYFLLFNKHIDVEITTDLYIVKIPII